MRSPHYQRRHEYGAALARARAARTAAYNVTLKHPHDAEAQAAHRAACRLVKRYERAIAERLEARR